MEPNIQTILCSIQRALLGKVTPNLRAVYIIPEKEMIKLILYYDKELSEEEQELASLIDTEFISDFPSPFYKTNFSVCTLEYPRLIPDQGFCAYFRYELAA